MLLEPSHIAGVGVIPLQFPAAAARREQRQQPQQLCDCRTCHEERKVERKRRRKSEKLLWN